jgi:hypothetical protein
MGGNPQDQMWDEYEKDREESKPDFPPFMSKEERDALIESGKSIYLHNVRHGETDFGPRYYVDLSATKKGQVQTLGFDVGTVESRDLLLNRVEEYFNNGGAEPVAVRMVKKGRSILLERPA